MVGSVSGYTKCDTSVHRRVHATCAVVPHWHAVHYWHAGTPYSKLGLLSSHCHIISIAYIEDWFPICLVVVGGGQIKLYLKQHCVC